MTSPLREGDRVEIIPSTLGVLTNYVGHFGYIESKSSFDTWVKVRTDDGRVKVVTPADLRRETALARLARLGLELANDA